MLISAATSPGEGHWKIMTVCYWVSTNCRGLRHNTPASELMFNLLNSQRDANEKLVVEEVDNFYNKAAKKSASRVPFVKSFLYLHSVIKAETFCLRKCPSHVQKYMPRCSPTSKK